MTINPTDLAAMLDVMSQALRTMPQLASHPAAQAIAAAVPVVEHQRTLGEWLDVHEQQLQARGYKAATIKNRTANLRHVRRLWGARPIGALKPHDVAMALKTFGPDRSSTAQRVLAELRDAYTEAIANGWTESHPAVHIKTPAHKVKRARLTQATWQGMRTLAAAGPQRWVESLLLLAVATGQRKADLAKMRFDHIVTDEAGQKYLRVEQQKEAGKGYGARVEIPLALRLDATGLTLAEVIEHCRASAKPGPTLLRKAGGGPIEESSLSARFHEHIVAVLGERAHREREWPSLHECRSLSARLYRDQGVDVQTLLGHKDADMTAVYTDDRGLSSKAREGGRVAAPHPPSATRPAASGLFYARRFHDHHRNPTAARQGPPG